MVCTLGLDLVWLDKAVHLYLVVFDEDSSVGSALQLHLLLLHGRGCLLLQSCALGYLMLGHLTSIVHGFMLVEEAGRALAAVLVAHLESLAVQLLVGLSSVALGRLDEVRLHQMILLQSLLVDVALVGTHIVLVHEQLHHLLVHQ